MRTAPQIGVGALGKDRYRDVCGLLVLKFDDDGEMRRCYATDFLLAFCMDTRARRHSLELRPDDGDDMLSWYAKEPQSGLHLAFCRAPRQRTRMTRRSD